MREQVIQFLEKEIDHEHIPGAVIYVSRGGQELLKEAVGYRTFFPEKTPMQMNQVFDVASLTKVVATLPAFFNLLEQGDIRLNDRVSYFIPEFATRGKEEITLFHLLTHTSGLPAHRPYFLEKLNREQVLFRICDEHLINSIGEKVVYCDLGYILLFEIIERVTGERFEVFTKKQIFEPLGMNETTFLPNYPKERYAPTEYSELLGEYKHHIVHDDNTEFMGGVSGHAGLYSTMEDLIKFTDMIEHNGWIHGNKFLSDASLNLSKMNHTPIDSLGRGLGWQLNTDLGAPCGSLFSKETYGHTGYTGTSFYMDPTDHLRVILLTNRVHFGRKDPIVRLRPRLHNLIKANV
ncbi:class A beta-lactamase-related serine hydrolase [Filobacillus milosensis]|uniref:Class A beta-lactamase-related serine hydrolase n=1 Tax=Filobacillus milosensis TaxID=94137 RepID=A0A4Y8IY10_9BACI|nr:serine hydrolase domain-containing protein [Filobacillus milosensis]TFB24414.1 class A beta-lactamase-related serine hydrolase [Filobacillus milosensis]